MAEINQYTFTYKEVVEALIRKQEIHDGMWAILVNFGIKGANLGPSDDQMLPTAIIPILQMGIVRVKEETNLSVDAAKVNPIKRK